MIKIIKDRIITIHAARFSSHHVEPNYFDLISRQNKAVRKMGMRRAFAVCLAIVFGSVAQAQEPLKDYVGRFAELDARIRTIDAADSGCTNYVAWMEEAIECKTKLDLANEIDPWLEDLAAASSNNWKILHAVAIGCHSQNDNWRKSIRLWESIQLMDRAYKLTPTAYSPENEIIRFHADYIGMLAENSFAEAQLPTNKTPGSLRPPSDSSFGRYDPSREMSFFALPASYESAANDGEIIRWLINCQPVEKHVSDYIWPKHNLSLADFALLLAGTHRNLPLKERSPLDGEEVPSEATRTILANLKDDETVLWEKDDGYRIIPLPEDYRYISVYQKQAEQGDRQAAETLGKIFITRCQLSRAARYFELAGNTNRVQSIRANQGAFLEHKSHIKGSKVSVDYLYRNGKTVSMDLYRITTASNLLARLISKEVFEWEMDLLKGDSDLFQKMESADQKKRIGEKIASWTVPLAPLNDHRDTIKTIAIPELEAGSYLLRAKMEDGNHSETILYVVDTLLISTSCNKGELYILCDAFTGKPLANQEIHFLETLGGKRPWYEKDKVAVPYTIENYALGVTDKDGIWISNSKNGRSAHVLAFLNRATPFAVEESSVSVGFPMGGRVMPRDSKFITTDRPLYRPGDTGYLKLWDINQYKVCPPELSNRDYKLPVQRSGITNENDECRLDDFGGADYTFTIPSNAPLGMYHTGDKEDSAPATFLVEEYRIPDFDITARLTSDHRIAVQANYTYGKLLSDGLIKLRMKYIKLQDINWYPDAPFDFLWCKGYWWNGHQIGKTETQSERYPTIYFDSISTNLNADGTCFIDLSSVSNGLEVLRTPGYFQIEAAVSDSTYKEFSKVLTIPVLFPEHSLCCWLESAFYPTNQPITCQIAFEHQTSPLRIEVRKLAAPDDPPIQTILVSGKQPVRLDSLPAGLYDVRLVSENGVASPPFQFTVFDDTFSGLTAEDPVRLIVEKGTYQADESIRFLLLTDQPGRYVYWLTLQQGFKPKLIYMDTASKIIESSYNEGLHQSSVLTTVQGQFHLDSCTIPIIAPEPVTGTLSLIPNKETYLPGEMVTLSIQSTDFSGKGRPSSVTVTVYNRSLDLIADDARSTDIRKYLYSEWNDCSGYTSMFSTYDRLLIKATYPSWVMQSLYPEHTNPLGYGLFSADNTFFGSDVLPCESSLAFGNTPRIREDFRDLAYWNATILTDSNGCAQVTFPMPDSLTEWKIVAWAMHTNYAASGETSVKCAKDFVLQLNTPRFLVEGDELEISGSLRNYTKESLSAAAECSVSGTAVRVQSPEKVSVQGLEPDREQLLYWNLNAVTEGTAQLTVAAQSAQASDGMTKPLPVLPHGMIKRGGNGGVLAGDHLEERVQIDLPEAVDPESIKLEVACSADMLESLAGALPYLADYPYGCTEQTLNRFLPSLVVLQTMEKLGITNLLASSAMPTNRAAVFDRDEIVKRAQAGIDRLENAGDSRGWGWNLDSSSRKDSLVSAWVLRGLRRASSNSVLTVDQDQIDRGLSTMVERMEKQMKPPAKGEATNKVSNTDAMKVLVATEASYATNTVPEFRLYLFDHVDQLSLYGKILLANAFELSGDTVHRDELVKFIEQYLENDPTTGACWLRTGRDRWWFWYNDPVEIQAWYLKLLNRIEPRSAKTADVARYLMQNRMYGDHWKSTRDTAICVEALCEFIVNNRPPSGKAAVELMLNGAPVSLSPSGETVLTNLVPGKNELVLKTKKGGQLFFDATWQYYTREKSITAEVCDLVSISRKVYRMDARTEKRAETPLQPGEVLKAGEVIEVELTLDANQDLEYLLAQDFKPAGFECLGDQSGWNYENRSYQEFHDERVSFYISDLSKGQTTLRYQMRAEHAGSMSALPATVELMYDPRQAANSDEEKLRVAR